MHIPTVDDSTSVLRVQRRQLKARPTARPRVLKLGRYGMGSTERRLSLPSMGFRAVPPESFRNLTLNVQILVHFDNYQKIGSGLDDD